MKERKQIRLNGYDYNKLGYYFVTICTQDKATFFGKIKNNKMVLSKIGKIANKLWFAIPEHFTNAKLDEYIVMPNHIHGIIIINNDFVGDADLRPTSNIKNLHTIKVNNQININVNTNINTYNKSNTDSKINHDRTKMILSKIIHGFKSSVTRVIRKEFNNYYFAWQRSFHDHVIRDEDGLNRIRKYIVNNPTNWESDRYN